MKAIGVIPARWASKRFEGKVLADLNGKPVIQHVWERARRCSSLEEVWIACDDERVMKAAKSFGAKAVMTPPELPSGTDRIALAVKDASVDVVVNIQGDEPLIEPRVIDALVKAMTQDPQCPMATVVKRITDEYELVNPNVVKAVLDAKGHALYFSRSVIPYNRDKGALSRMKYFKHLGIYAYRKDFLKTWPMLPPSPLEQTEKLEQLRVLEAGFRIKTVETDVETIGVDTPEDLERVRRLMGEG